MKPSQFAPTAIINDKPSPEFQEAVDVLRKLGYSRSLQAQAKAWADGGQRFAKDNNLKPMKLSVLNVGKLLKDVPSSLILHHALNKDLTPAEVQRNARDERAEIIKSLANRNGWMDHGQLFSRDGKPYCLVGHPYDFNQGDMESLCEVAKLWGLHASVSPVSHYYPGRTLSVILGRLS